MSPIRQRIVLAILAILGAVVIIGSPFTMNAQEHSYAPADIEAGRDLFMGNCSGCHGQTGDQVHGADLSTGRFRRGSADEDLIRVIHNGIPGTSMPPHESMSVGDTRTVVAFLRSLPTGTGLTALDTREVRIGDQTRGRALFAGGGECMSCHSVNGEGGIRAPDLGRVGSQRSPGSIEQSILEPGAEVRAGNRYFEVVDLNGRSTRGRLLNQDTHSIQMLDTEEQLVAFRKSEVRGFGFIGSPMPSYRDELTEDELADLVGYLVTLREETAP
jgi:putative heme-binding domain-containing protein